MDREGLEAEIRGLDGVVGAVVLEDEDHNSADIEVFVSAGTDVRQIRAAIAGLLAQTGRMQSARRISVYELTDEPTKPEPPEIEPVAEARPSLRSVRVTPVAAEAEESDEPDLEAEVNLLWKGYEASGSGRARKTPHALRLVAATTLEAAQAFVKRKGVFILEGVTLVEVLGRQMVVVMVRVGPSSNDLLVGSALVRQAPIHDAAVRATLDAVNRRLGVHALESRGWDIE